MSESDAKARKQIRWALSKIWAARRQAANDYHGELLEALARSLERQHPKLRFLWSGGGMTNARFREFTQQFLKDMDEILVKKGADYSIRSDRMAHFKEIAAQTGSTPFQVWYTYFAKHLFAIQTFLREGDVASEPIYTRFLDLANYALLGAALHYDRSYDDPNPTPPVDRSLTSDEVSRITVPEVPKAAETLSPGS